jgi:ribosomal protein S18 acetylase RimI-like enzyme
MNPTLYFLRSSEQKIATDMLHYAMRLDALGKTLEELPRLRVHEKQYGLSHRDLGLYALEGHEVAGAAWIRLLDAKEEVPGFIDERTPLLTIGVKPKFRSRGIGSTMLEQLLLEAGALYEQVSVSVLTDSPAVRFYERFGFVRVGGSEGKSPVDGSDVFTMVRTLEKAEVKRPAEGYDPTYWMD